MNYWEDVCDLYINTLPLHSRDLSVSGFLIYVGKVLKNQSSMDAEGWLDMERKAMPRAFADYHDCVLILFHKLDRWQLLSHYFCVQFKIIWTNFISIKLEANSLFCSINLPMSHDFVTTCISHSENIVFFSLCIFHILKYLVI